MGAVHEKIKEADEREGTRLRLIKKELKEKGM